MKEDIQRPSSVRKHNHKNDANDMTEGKFLSWAHKRQTEWLNDSYMQTSTSSSKNHKSESEVH